jgi:hypothetical protein
MFVIVQKSAKRNKANEKLFSLVFRSPKNLDITQSFKVSTYRLYLKIFNK